MILLVGLRTKFDNTSQFKEYNLIIPLADLKIRGHSDKHVYNTFSPVILLYANLGSPWFQGWFHVDPDTGRVTVSATLDREVAEVVVLKILVNDTKGTVNTPQTALGKQGGSQRGGLAS